MGERFRPGTEAWIASDSPSSSFSAVFEDNGETGYFYAYDRSNTETAILDAVQIYNVASVADRDRDSEVDIVWSSDGLKAGLRINGRLHAVLDFQARRAYCRSNLPPPSGAWAASERPLWNETLANLLN